MDAPDDLSSPRRRQLQGPRPPRLAVRKDSHKIEKPAVDATPRLLHTHARKQATALPLHQHHPRRAPVIIYDALPRVIHSKPGDFMALVQRLTGQGAAAAPAGVDPKEPPVAQQPPPPPHPARCQPLGFLRSPSYGSADSFDAGAVSGAGAPGRRGILSPAALPPAASSGQFSLLPFNATRLTWLTEMFPFLRSAGTRPVKEGLGVGAPFVLDNKQQHSSLPLAEPAMAPPRPTSISSSSGSSGITFSAGDGRAPVKKTHLLDKVFTPADEYTKRSRRRLRKRGPMSSPNWELADPCSAASSTRRLSKQLVRVRNIISPSSGARVSFAWLGSIKSLATEAQDCLRDLHYRMMLAILGVGVGTKCTVRESFQHRNIIFSLLPISFPSRAHRRIRRRQA